MTVAKEDLLAILRIGHETSIRGAGISWREALRQVRYADRRANFGSSELRQLLVDHPSLTESWIAYSEDKSTSGGWYLLPSCAIGRLSDPESHEHFESQDEAVAEYVVRELDFGTGLQAI